MFIPPLALFIVMLPKAHLERSCTVNHEHKTIAGDLHGVQGGGRVEDFIA